MIYVNFILIMTIIVAITAVVISLMYAVTKSFIVDLKKYLSYLANLLKKQCFLLLCYFVLS